jgi:hypothetical protein
MIRRTSFVLLEVVLGVAVLLGLLVAASAWRLSQGPLSIQFLLPYAEDLLDSQDTRFRAELDDLILTWAGWERALDIRAVGVRLREKDAARPLARVGEVSVTFSARALIRGKIAPTSLELIRPRIRLARDENGKIEFGMGDAEGQPEAQGGDVLTMLLAELSAPVRSESDLRYLNRVSVVGAVMQMENRQLGITWGVRHADITIERAPVGLRAAFDFDVDLDADLRTNRPEFHGEAYFDRTANIVDVAFTFNRLNSNLIGQRFAALAELTALKTDLNGDAELRVDLDGNVRSAKFRISGAGGTFAAPGINTAPLAFKKITAQGELNRSPDQLKLGRMDIDFGTMKVTLAAVATRTGETAAINATIGLPAMPVDDLGKYWPPDAGVGARTWVLANMHGGSFNDFSASLTARVKLSGRNAGSMNVDSINGRFNIDGITIHYLNPMPPITNASATATFSDTRFDFAARSGRIGDLQIASGAVHITDIGGAREMLAVNAGIRGPVRAALDLVAHPRLKLLSKVGLTSAGAAGTHVTRLQVEFPLLKALRADEVLVDASSDIEGLALSNVLKGRDISNGQVALLVSNNRLSAKGTAIYADTPARFDWAENFAASASVKTRLTAGLTADARLRTLFGIEYPQILEGPVPVNLIFEQQRSGGQTLSAGLNLKDAKLSVPGFDWAKQPGREGTAHVTAVFEGGTVSAVPLFRIEAGVFRAAGRLGFGRPKTRPESGSETGSDPILATLDLDRFELGSTSFSATARRAADQSFLIDIKGEGFDASPFIDQNLGGVDMPDLPAFSLTGRFEKFWIGPSAPTNNVRMTLKRDPAHWQQIVVEGELPAGGKAISIKMLPTGDGHSLSIYSADAGSLLKAMDVTDTIRAGSIEVNGTRKDGSDATWRGTAEMKRFRVTNAPNLARLFSLASLTGINDVVSGKGIAFDRIGFPFVFKNEVLTIADAQAFGSELGLTATGTVDFKKDAININGTIIPAYTINSLLGRIPVLGTLLTGEKGGGIFAAAYKVSGPVEKPKMAVNPLSALAPGFLRKLLGGGGGGPNDGKTPDQEERQREEKERQRGTSGEKVPQ